MEVNHIVALLTSIVVDTANNHRLQWVELEKLITQMTVAGGPEFLTNIGVFRTRATLQTQLISE
jgi:hypothetical protein